MQLNISRIFRLISSDLDDDTKIQQLKTKIVDLAKVEEPLEIRCGYPPKVIAALDEDTLKTCGISAGGEKITNFMFLCNLRSIR